MHSICIPAQGVKRARLVEDVIDIAYRTYCQDLLLPFKISPESSLYVPFRA